MNLEHKELFKHSGNYLFAVIANKALSFISIPVLTYLLTVEDYGVYNVFLSTLQVVAVILTLNTEVAISRYFYDAKDDTDFKRFVGTSLWFSFLVFCIMSLLLVVFSPHLSSFCGLEWLLVILLIPMSLSLVLDSVFQQIYQPLMKSRKIATISSINAYGGFILSVLFILSISEKKYYGLVYGTLTMAFFLGIYYCKEIFKYATNVFDIKYLKYILSYSLPYLPYSLSSVILIQFGKLIIGQQEGFHTAGLYSFASNIAMLMMVVITVCHSAWNPFYYRYMNDKDYDKIDGDYDIIWKATLIFGAFLSLFCYEIGIILAKPQYLSALYLVPILVVGYVFYQWSYVFLRNVSYVKKTIWNAIVVIASGVLNIVLNAILIKEYQEVGVAVSFSLSYLFMLLFSWLINKYILCAYSTSMKKFVIPFLYFVPIVAVSVYFRIFTELSILVILCKLLILLTFTLVIMYKFYKSYLWELLKR